jgi:uncharacterized membrane protein YbhN (UPF0104 family)
MQPAAQEAAPAALPFERLDGRLKLLLLLALAVSLLVGVFLLVGKVAGYARTLDSLKEAKPLWLVVCFVSQVVSYAGYIALFRGLAAPERRRLPRLWLSIKVVFASLGATRLLATGGAGGLAVLYWAFHHTGRTRRQAAVRMLAFNVLLYAFFGAVTLAACSLLLVGIGGDAPVWMTLPWIVGLTACFAAAAWVTSPGRAARLARPAEGKVRSAFSAAAAATVFARRLLAHPHRNRGAVLGPPVYWFGDMLCLWAALRAFDVRLSPWLLVVVYATGYLANFLPLPTGGIGGVDAATTFAITAVGVPLSQAMLGVFAYRFFSFLLPTLPAVIAIPSLPRAGAELDVYAAETRRLVPATVGNP